MGKRYRLTRRDFLRFTGLGSASIALASCTGQLRMPGAGRSASSGASDGAALTPGRPDLAVELKAASTTAPILPGQETPVLHYQSAILGGDSEMLQTLEDSYLGPVFRVKQGQRLQVRLKNELSEPTIIHWHGLRVPEAMDGHPRHVIQPGMTYDYDFTVRDRAGTYWFHPHPHQLTGRQAYFGLAGLFIVSDDEEAALGLPSGTFDIPLVLQDRQFDDENALVYLPNGMMDQMNGFVGDTILINGKVAKPIEVQATAYRLRFLNGSNSRIYKLAWKDGSPLIVIATDGGLLESPVTKPYVMLAPGERVEVWVQFSAGTDPQLVSLPFDAGSADPMMGMMHTASALSNGAAFDITTFQVGAEGPTSAPLPQRLSTFSRHRVQDAVNGSAPRTVAITMQGMIHTLNGRLFDMDAVANDEIVHLGDLEAWEFVNGEGGSMEMGMGMTMNMDMPHPMHMHGVRFLVAERKVDANSSQQYAQVSAGFINEGWKDTVLVMPGERVKVLVRFEDFPGTYLYHCHNLEHEDAGMMRNFRIDS